MPARRIRKQYSPFERRKRAAARKALYGSLLLVLVAAGSGSRFVKQPLLTQRWAGVDWAKVPEVDLLRRYVRIDTTQASGDEVAAARFLAGELAKSGIQATVEELPGRHANLWAFVEGADPKAIVLHQHMDTDPVANPALWTHTPWSADIQGPWLYGRGTFDMKSVGIAQLVALQRLVASGRPLARSVLFLATGSEEQGSDLGLRWILHAHPELVERFGVFLTEGGAVEARDADDIKYWGTEIAQKRFVDVIFCSGSRQRLDDLRQDLLDLTKSRRLVPEVESFLRIYGTHRDTQRIRGLLRDPAALAGQLNRWDGLPRYLRWMLLDITHTGKVREAAGGGWVLNVKLGLLPGVSLDEARDTLLPSWATFGVPFTVREAAAVASGSPTDNADFRRIAEVLRERYPQAPSGPWILASSVTDARFIRPLGIPAYGFTPFPVLSTETLHIGSSNEQIDLPGFLAGVELYAELLARLAL